MRRFSLLLKHDACADAFDVAAEALKPALRRYPIEGGECLIVGDPVHAGRRDDAAVMAAFRQATSIDTFAKGLDGAFLIIVRRTKPSVVSVISDRFASYAFYFAERGEGRLAASLSLSQLVRDLGGLAADPSAFIEFLHFRRIFGEKTYDRRCRYLASASILEHRADGCDVRKYWQPDYGAPRLGARNGADAIAGALRGAMRTSMSGPAPDRRYALFMSGGLDSRALLAAAEQKPLCVTTCGFYNNEAQTAEAAAATAGARFMFVPRPPAPYEGRVGTAVYYGGGQHVLTEAHFLDYEDSLGGEADCFFLGLGLDVFLGGLYQPKRPVRWLGRDTLHFALKPLSDDIAADFMGGVKYRLTTSDPWSVVRPDLRRQLRDDLHDSIGAIAARGRALGAERYDLWEYLHLHNFSRHYSFLMIQSVRHWAECQVPALCNAMLDIAIALPAELKVNSTAYLAALNQLSPPLMQIRNANTNVRAGQSFRHQSAIRAARIVANRMGGRFKVSPGIADRSWPSPGETIRASRDLTDRVAALGHSERLAGLDLFDLDAVRARVEEHDQGRADHSTLLLMLVTLDEFCRQVH